MKNLRIILKGEGRVLGKDSTPTNLKEEGVTQGVAEAENKVLLGVLRHSLYNAVLHPDSVLGDTVVVYPRPAVTLVEKERAT